MEKTTSMATEMTKMISRISRFGWLKATAHSPRFLSDIAPHPPIPRARSEYRRDPKNSLARRPARRRRVASSISSPGNRDPGAPRIGWPTEPGILGFVSPPGLVAMLASRIPLNR
uniref:Uncharacterized protein n=1 Tax=Oryza barthii TaxID=65489 RepID=A0A0D3EL50_9ORYZ